MQEWIATAPFGLEGVVADELRALGFMDVRAQPGGALFRAELSGALRANLWLRTADRVLLVLGRFEARSFEELFEGVKAIAWEDWIAKDAAFPVRGKCARSQLMSVSDCQSITKKAIVERLKQKHRIEWFQETKETCAVDVSLHSDVALLTLDTSGEALHRRGYRTWNGEAPLRETLAAALVQLSPWHKDAPLYDPMCGTGTLLIEAAMLQANRAPGLTRSFDCENWRFMPQKEMVTCREEAKALFDPEKIHDIAGSDIDPQALELAGRHVKQAGLTGRITLTQSDVRDVQLPYQRGAFIVNPPYGERLSDRDACEGLYRALRDLQNRHPGFSLSAISAHPGFTRCYGKKPDKVRRLYNGRLECEFVTYFQRPQGR